MNGLTEEEVKKKTLAGEVNVSNIKTTSVSDIIKKHTLTLFNILLFTLAILVFLFGQKRDAIFIFIAIFATALAIINDIRAKRTIDKLSLISENPATVVRDGKEKKISPEKIVKGDTIKFSLGDQISVDSKVIEGEIEVNESLITGESNNIKKHPGDLLTSGSFVVSGVCFAKVLAVGNNNFISKILLGTKKIKDNRSKIFQIINKIIKLNSIILIPAGLFLFLKQFFLETATLETATTSTVAALVAMIPEGLVLLTSSVLALATIHLSKKKVLVQDFYSLETLARVDTICLDKTGTLTTGDMKVEKIVPTENHSEKEIIEILKTLNGALGESNQTSKALLKKFGKRETKVDELYHFSSEKKFSGVRIGEKQLLIGAYDFLTKDPSKKKTEESLSSDFRVLTVLEKEKEREEILGFVLLSDEVRKNAKKLLDFFAENDTKVKIISGDNKKTIEKILSACGFRTNGEIRLIDLSETSEKNYKQLVENFDIFARVKPEQKKNLIKALKENGHTVAMTGDGVNDCLALKEADCGISLGSGSDAARQVSDIVLLDDDFSAVSDAIFEGRQTINNVTRSSALFLNKTIFATALTIIFIFLNFRYPFSPIEMTLINFVIIGAPSFLLALETNHSRIKDNFKDHVLKNSVPPALATIFAVIATAVVSNNLGFSWQETITFSCVLTSFIGILLVWKVSRPLNKLRAALLLGLAGVVALVFLIPFARDFFSIALLPVEKIALLLVLGLVSTLIFVASSRLLSRQSF